jgi:hypothetical protein
LKEVLVDQAIAETRNPVKIKTIMVARSSPS